MRQTLFHIPHEFLGIPVLGFGWALAAIVLFAVVFLLISRKNQSISKLLEEQGIILGVAALIVVFLLPLIEERISDGSSTPWIVGLPIRGYGVMLMLGVVSAVSVAMMRCDKAGLSREAFFSLATWTIVAGMIGARVFYCVQKWDELGGTLGEKLWTKTARPTAPASKNCSVTLGTSSAPPKTAPKPWPPSSAASPMPS